MDTDGGLLPRAPIPADGGAIHCVLVVFDVSSRLSFRSVPDWIDFARRELGAQVPILVVGAKCDTRYREVRRPSSLQVPYVEISAKTGENVARAVRMACSMSEPIGSRL